MRFLSINETINALKNGEIVAIPTDGIFGIFCKESDSLNQIYEVKNRSQSKKCCTYTSNMKFLKQSDPIIGMTYIYENQGYRSAKCHPVLEYIINETGDLFGTSCNVSGYIPITHYQHINLDINILPINCLHGIESTIISLDNHEVLRSGYIKTDEFKLNNSYKCEITSDKLYNLGNDCVSLSKNFWFWIHQNKSINFNISCDCYNCQLLKEYLKIIQKSI